MWALGVEVLLWFRSLFEQYGEDSILELMVPGWGPEGEDVETWPPCQGSSDQRMWKLFYSLIFNT